MVETEAGRNPNAQRLPKGRERSSYFIGAYLRSANLEGRRNKRMIENLVRQDGKGELYLIFTYFLF